MLDHMRQVASIEHACDPHSAEILWIFAERSRPPLSRIGRRAFGSWVASGAWLGRPLPRMQAIAAVFAMSIEVISLSYRLMIFR